MKIHPHNRKSKDAIALIVVMIAIAVFSIMAGAFAFSMKVEDKLAHNANNEQQLLWLGRSGVEYERWYLAQEANNPREPYTSLNQYWAGGPGDPGESNSPLAALPLKKDIKLGDGYFSITSVIDLERKININVATTPMLQQTLTLMGVDADSLSVVADSIQDWIDSDDAPRVAGAENDYYQSLSPPYYAKNAPIDDLSELLLVKGVTSEMYWGPAASEHTPANFQNQKSGLGNTPGQTTDYAFGLEDVFTPISSGRVNINTAGTNVLQLLPGVDNITAEAIVKQRAGPDGIDGTEDDTPFRNNSIGAVPGINPAVANQINQLITTRSSTFEVHITAHIGDSSRKFVAILYQNGTNIQVLRFYWK